MNALNEYVDWKLTHANKMARAKSYPLVLEKYKINSKMKELKLYGNSLQNGIPSQDTPVEIQSVGLPTANLFNSKCKMSGRLNVSNIQARNKSLTAMVLVEDIGFARLKISSAADFVGKTIFFTFNPVTENVNVTSTALVVCDDRGNIIRTSAVPQIWENGYYTSIVVPEDVSDTDTLDLEMHMKNGVEGEKIEITDVMIYEGNEPLAYEPAGKYRISITKRVYNGNSESEEKIRICNIYLDEPLRSFGAYADYIDFKNKTVVRHMYEEVFKGNENWTFINVVSGAAGFRFDLRGGGGVMASINAADNGMCNKYPVVKARADKTCSGGATLHQIVDFIDSSFTSVDEWNAYLASEYANGTPLKFLHTLATPNVESIECDLPVLTGDTTVFEVESSVKPSDMYGKYIKG